MKNSADQGGCYPPRPNAEEFYGVSPFRSLFFCSPKSQSRPQGFSVNG